MAAQKLTKKVSPLLSDKPEEKEPIIVDRETFLNTDIKERKKLIVDVYRQNYGSIYHSAIAVGISREELIYWIKDNSWLKKDLDTIKKVDVDSTEIQDRLEYTFMKNAIETQDKESIKWLLERKYGFNNKKEVDITNKHLTFKFGLADVKEMKKLSDKEKADDAEFLEIDD